MTDSRFWDAQAATFDAEPDHGLLDAEVRAAWAEVLLPALPPAPARIADLGCGTGSVALLFAEAGHDVSGVDYSARMIDAAMAKTGAVAFHQGDAADPPLPSSTFDVVFARHVLWALSDPDRALARWCDLLRPGGRLVLVEGRWHTGAGISAADCRALALRHRKHVTVRQLDDPRLWGKPISDERYLLVGRRLAA
ncbi:class I SAM-dependent methyltransferase [Actinokineospora iranica]|uniref:Methyltransferase domain-containing protein n=1 Tax=Actinokineospora iranica TaxID=1271860 RepID=A0A1G6JHG7_9PSEU|nr:class I SAM-dependent methyltransferase [Actinokineospora iranica]SDC18121.1 Methyltransferase domain-containing protein [Actinokineospora iranica]